MLPHRKQLRHFEISNQPRFLTFSCSQRLPLFQSDRIKDAFVARVAAARQQQGFRLLGWVIMPEHVHLIVVPRLPEAPIPKVFSALKRRFAEQVIRRWRELDAPILARLGVADGSTQFWQSGGGYDRNLRDEAQVREKLDYMHMNPVKRGLVADPLDWRWSSARWHAGIREEDLELDSL